MIHAHTKRDAKPSAQYIRQLKGDREQLRKQCDRAVTRMIRTQEIR